MIRFLPWCLLSALVMLNSCATPTSPKGGPRDEAHPVIDTALSTPKFQTKFLKEFQTELIAKAKKVISLF
jgi:hypothetical protein